MDNKYIINIIDNIGLNYYDVINILEIIDLGDTYNIITNNGDLFLYKDYLNIIYNNYNNIESIEYKTDHMALNILTI